MQSFRSILWPRRGSSPPRARFIALNMVLALVAVLVPTALIPAGAAAGDPNQVNFTLEGCRNDGTITFDLDGPFVCDDSVYTTGNLGKGWNELDLVPHRVTLRNDNGTQTYTFVVAGDYRKAPGTGIGWDLISDLTLIDDKSADSCPETLTGTNVITDPGDGVGGASETIYQTVTITQQANTTCVYDYYQELAIGASEFSGSSLQSNLWNQSLTSSGIGQKRLSLPVNQIKPQELNKDMSATQGSAHVWNLTKTVPESLSFGQTCIDDSAALSQTISITVAWEKLTVNADEITVVTNIYATNPASRTLTVTVTDQIRSGTDVLETVTSPAVAVPARETELILTHTMTVSSETVDLNDIAIATYSGAGAPIVGTTTAIASAPVVTTTSAGNETAIITDDESITGGFTYSVAAPTTGSFVAPYVAGTPTTSQSWTSGVQTGSGAVTFEKTVFSPAGFTGEGVLSDDATLTPVGGIAKTVTKDVAVSAAATVSLTISKSIPNVLTGEETASFDFDVLDAEGLVVASRTIDFSANDTSGSALVSGLAPGTYTVHEVADASGQWATQADQTVTIALPDCAGSVAFNNTPNPLGISLDKEVNGADHATAADALLVHSGDPLTYSVVITNTGLVPLTITTLADTLRDPGFDGTCTQGVGSVLEPGDSFTCTYPMTAAGDATNLASVSGVDSLHREVTASDRTFVDVINPAIQVVKTVDDETPDVGQTVTYSYVVTNTGDTTLSAVTVTDDVLGAIGTIATLAPGASATLTKAVVITADSPSRNVAVATGTDVLGKKVTDDDDATIAVTAVLGIVEVQPVVLPAELPRTGLAIGGILILGFTLLLGGLALRSTRRRRLPA